jgi:hypothetical protein
MEQGSMFFIPLSQIESVELVIHSLKAAGGQADCRSCPAGKVCMKQCLTIAGAIEAMFGEGELADSDAAEILLADELSRPAPAAEEEPPAGNVSDGPPRLKLVKS